LRPSDRPVVVEAAISPFRPDAPVHDQHALKEEVRECLDAGAGVVHYHHDARLDRDEAIDSMIGLCREIAATHPTALLYPGILSGTNGSEHMAHLVPLADAGVLGLAPLDPGAAVPYDLDDDGIPTGHGWVWNSFSVSKRVAASMQERSVPLTIGVYEPLQLRWALAMEAAGRLAPGSMVKLYFGGSASLFRVGRPALNFGLPPTPQALDLYLSMMEGSVLPWSVGAMGGVLLELPLARHALERGGHLRVGVEDIGRLDPNTNATTKADTNVDTVRSAVALCAEVGRPVATGDEVRGTLGPLGTTDHAARMQLAHSHGEAEGAVTR
jgi:uncharacterized protein (DUF849 family)